MDYQSNSERDKKGTERQTQFMPREQQRFTSSTNIPPPQDKSSTIDFIPAEPCFLQISQDGTQTFHTQDGKERKIFPSPNIYFHPQASGLSKQKVQWLLSEQRINKAKQYYTQKYNVNPNSHLYNYQPMDTWNIYNAYPNQTSKELKVKIMKQSESLGFRNFFASKFLLIYTVFTLTTFTKKWYKLTCNYRLRLALFVVPLIVKFQANRGLYLLSNEGFLKYHTQFENVIHKHQRQLDLLI